MKKIRRNLRGLYPRCKIRFAVYKQKDEGESERYSDLSCALSFSFSLGVVRTPDLK